MSQASIERIPGKAMLDAGFLNTLLANPDRALAGFALTGNEKRYLKRMDAETLEQLAGILAERNHMWRMGIHFRTFLQPGSKPAKSKRAHSLSTIHQGDEQEG